MSSELLMQLSGGLAVLAVLLAVIGWLVAIVSQLGKPGGFNLRHGERPAGFAFVCIMGAGLIMGVALFGVMAAALWWLGAHALVYLTPERLALISIGVGVLPLLLSMLGVAAAKVTGGRVDASGAYHCRILGRDVGGIVYTLFMMYVVTVFSAGLTVLGLIGSGLWALFG